MCIIQEKFFRIFGSKIMCYTQIIKWTTENGLKFSKEKTKCVHFCNQRKLYLDPVLKIDHAEISIVEQYKYLGVIFYLKLSFIPHIKYLRIKCNKTIQLLRTIAHTNWGKKQRDIIKIMSLINQIKTRLRLLYIRDSQKYILERTKYHTPPRT